MFDALKEKNRIVKFIKEYYEKTSAKGAILGISGGKDSAVVAALMVEALGKENVIGVTLPCHSKEEDKNYAKVVSDKFGFKLLNFDLTNVFDEFKNELESSISKEFFFNIEDAKNSDINIKPRLRMTTLYYIGALLSKIKSQIYLVCGTSNKCELYVGYFTKGGDSVHDIAPIADLTVEEVIRIGEVLDVPKEVLYRVPSDGLSDLSDEEKLGVKYSDIALYMKDNNTKEIDEKVKKKIELLHEGCKHKFIIPKYQRKEK